VLEKFSAFAMKCYIQFEIDGLKHAIKDFASKWLLPIKLILWEINVARTPACEIIYVSIGKA
jgi:hypothetical protein